MRVESRSRRKSLALIMASGLALVSGCRPKVDYFPGGDVQTGTASWYGPEFHGRTTSSREVYDMNDLTAAHKSLPFGTYVMVINLNNGRSVIVRINDRGPFVKDRVIDLSYAAARALDIVGPGTAPVRLEVLRNLSPPASALMFSVQAGSFILRANAETLRLSLARHFANVYLSEFETPRQVYYRVRIKAQSRQEAEQIAGRVSALGYMAIIFEEQ
ncbi:MAG: septal ring lytic transglycosylase RlpA family protein [Acidobacteriota bacterium]